MSYFDQIISILRSQSVFEILLPFILTFAIFYGAIRKMRIFGSDTTANRISVIIAVVAALYVTIFTPVGITISTFFARFFAISSVWMVSIIVFMMIFGLFMFLDPEAMKEQFMKRIRDIAIFTIALTVITWYLSGGLQLFTKSRIPWLSEDNIILIVIVLAVAGIIIFVSKEDEGEKKSSGGGGSQVKI